MKSEKLQGRGPNPLLALSLGTLGVVYGDIGTSPLYALRECFHSGGHHVPLSPENVLGVLSLIFWSLTVIISVKYLVFVLRADNEGEGGILALMSLLTPGSRTPALLTGLGLFGSALLYGDSVLTPAVSVLSAVEGLEVATMRFVPFVIPVTVVVLIVLFSFQRRGTGQVGAMFGPIMLLWFGVIGTLGALHIFDEPRVFLALNPWHALRFLLENGRAGFLILGSVFLVMTGGEALYADMGHFGRRPIRITWFVLVFPALLLNYFGQGALLLKDPSAAANPFYRLAPAPLVLPLVALSTIAAIIASQAVISGAFSLTRQAVQLGFSPRLFIRHTSASQVGQIYVPAVNRMLMIGAIAVVIVFRSSSALAAAYGIAVTGTMAITTILLYKVTRRLWKWPLAGSLTLLVVFLTIDLAFFSATIVKVFSGGWFALGIAALVYMLMSSWRMGREGVSKLLLDGSVPTQTFLSSLQTSNVTRVPGTAIFMSRQGDTIPTALLHNIKHNKVVHQTVVLMTIRTLDIARCSERDRVQVTALGNGVWRFVVSYGFMEDPDVPATLQAMPKVEGVDLSNPSYFLSRETLIATKLPTLPLWRAKLFVAMLRNATNASQFFRLPPDRVVELGMQMRI